MITLTQKAYELLKKVPKGKVTTYKELAHALNTRAYRAIGQAMKKNPYAPIIPCHRVVSSDGTLGGFMGKTDGKEIQKKKKLLATEGVIIKNNRVIDFAKTLHRFH